MTDLVTEVLRQAPEWARRDPASRQQAARVRAEDTLAAMIAAAINGGDLLKVRADPVPSSAEPAEHPKVEKT